MVDESSFAELLREMRLAHGVTQEELAERAQLSVRAISDLERGLKRAPRARTLRMVVGGLGLSERDAAQLHAAALPVGVHGERRAHRHNLPRELSSFVGRERVLAELRSLLKTKPLLTLIGAELDDLLVRDGCRTPRSAPTSVAASTWSETLRYPEPTRE